jgi:two-component system, NarL family, nitrate/nitrite response regulator NarL
MTMGVRNMLEADANFKVLAEACDGVEALQRVDQFHPDVLLLDLSMPRLSGMETLRELSLRHHATKPVLLTSNVEKKQMLEALRLGVRGIVTKSALPTELHECIRAVLDGQYWAFGTSVNDLVTLLQELMRESEQSPKQTFGLTLRGLQITALIAEGCINKDIAAEFKISGETVKHHLKQIFDKTGVSNRLELAIFAMNHGLVRDL